MSWLVEPFDKAVLVLYRDGREVGTLTFEADGFGNGPPSVRLNRERVDEQWSRLAAPVWSLLAELERPVFRLAAACVTLRLSDAPTEAATPPR